MLARSRTLGFKRIMHKDEKLARLISKSEQLLRKSEELNAAIEKLRSKIEKLQYNQIPPKKSRCSP